MKNASQRTWGGRFASGPAEAVRKFSESISFDQRLWREDIAGSLAHAEGLVKAGILTRGEGDRIAQALRKVARQIASGQFNWDPALEDVHMNIEAALGAAGKKLHTARSRNDQVATDLRLWLRTTVAGQGAAVAELQRALLDLAASNAEVILPGYTHLQRAQPVSFAHHLLAYVEMLGRDTGRLTDCLQRANFSPLGSGAIAGSTLLLPREFVAGQLGFDGVTQNSMDAVSDRDFVVEYLAAVAICGMHLSRLAEDLILWSSAEFGFVWIGDAYTTGSSLMPQKKNPDVCELVRGKTGRLYGNLVSVLTMLKGLPLTYNRDMQEDKEPLFDSADTLTASLEVLAGLLRDTQVNRQRCEAAAADPLLLATDLADFLVQQGMPFREAHHAVGALVAETEKTKTPLPKLAAARYGAAAAKVFDLHRALAVRRATGAPAPRNVQRQIARWQKLLR